jgi:hypothetical protein
LTSLTAVCVEFIAQVFWQVVSLPHGCRQLMSETHALSPAQVWAGAQQLLITQLAQLAVVNMKPHAVVLPPPLLLPELLLLPPELLPLLELLPPLELLLPELLPLLEPLLLPLPLPPPLELPLPGAQAFAQLPIAQLPIPWSAGAQSEVVRIDWQPCDCSADELYVPPGQAQPTKSLHELS